MQFTIEVPRVLLAQAIAEGRVVVYSAEPDQRWMREWSRAYREDAEIPELVDLGGEA